MRYRGFEFYATAYPEGTEEYAAGEIFCEIYKDWDEGMTNLLDCFTLKQGVDVPEGDEGALIRHLMGYIDDNYPLLMNAVGNDMVAVDREKFNWMFMDYIGTLEMAPGPVCVGDAVRWLLDGIGGDAPVDSVKYEDEDGEIKEALVFQKERFAEFVGKYIEALENQDVMKVEIDEILLDCIGKKRLFQLGFGERLRDPWQSVESLINKAEAKSAPDSGHAEPDLEIGM